jgi:hypothetical protein
VSSYHIFDSSDINDTSEIKDEWGFSQGAVMPPDVFRFVNNLDVGVDIKVYGTDSRDAGQHDRLKQLDIFPDTGVAGVPLFRSSSEGLTGATGSISVASGASDSLYLSRR